MRACHYRDPACRRDRAGQPGTTIHRAGNDEPGPDSAMISTGGCLLALRFPAPATAYVGPGQPRHPGRRTQSPRYQVVTDDHWADFDLNPGVP